MSSTWAPWSDLGPYFKFDAYHYGIGGVLVETNQLSISSNAYDGKKVFILAEPKHVVENFTWHYNTYTIFVEKFDGNVVKLAVVPVAMLRDSDRK